MNKSEINGLACEIADDMGIMVKGVSLANAGGSIRVIVDKLGGVTLSECAEFNRLMSGKLTSADLGNARVTVTPPVSARWSLEDFRNRIAFNVRVRLKNGGVLEGPVVKVEGERVVVASPLEESFRVADVDEARVLL